MVWVLSEALPMSTQNMFSWRNKKNISNFGWKKFYIKSFVQYTFFKFSYYVSKLLRTLKAQNKKVADNILFFFLLILFFRVNKTWQTSHMNC